MFDLAHLQPVTDYAHLFATLIARCAKDIDVLIESLPNEDSSTELQVSLLLIISICLFTLFY